MIDDMRELLVEVEYLCQRSAQLRLPLDEEDVLSDALDDAVEKIAEAVGLARSTLLRGELRFMRLHQLCPSDISLLHAMASMCGEIGRGVGREWWRSMRQKRRWRKAWFQTVVAAVHLVFMTRFFSGFAPVGVFIAQRLSFADDGTSERFLLLEIDN